MLLNLNPGSWEQQYAWLTHARWEGGHFIDLVAPTFLFCIGAAIPLALQRRAAEGASTGQQVRHILARSLLLVLIGVALNLYPDFDLAHVRLPGVLQRIGLAYGLCALFLLASAGPGLRLHIDRVAAAIAILCAGWYVLLMHVPVPGYGAPGLDPEMNWPALLDRALFTTQHMFKWWPVNGKVVFDPDGLLTTLPVYANVLFGALTWELRARHGSLPRWMPWAGGALMALAVLLHGAVPIIKSLWTSTTCCSPAALPGRPWPWPSAWRPMPPWPAWPGRSAPWGTTPCWPMCCAS
jgi:predicted acyltransferase